MHSKLVLTALVAAFISSTSALQLPYLSSILKREDIAPGSPLYNCHEACGEVILISESGDYCTNSTFTTDLNSCLKCALTYNIWQYYGDSVKSAATSCSDDATPSSSSATSGTSATTATTTDSSSTTDATASSAITSKANTSATATATSTASVASASASTGAGFVVQPGGAFPLMAGAAVWAFV